jgi:anthranilate synthase/aminodeoxychorismate synthase-like glutamine amidotransferase
MKILVIDNYDSFTYNLVQLVGKFTQNVIVKRNDEITTEEIKKIDPDRILISPGPGRPENSGITLNVIDEFCGKIPILGVCLGHQAIGLQFGADIVHAPVLMHGKNLGNISFRGGNI